MGIIRSIFSLIAAGVLFVVSIFLVLTGLLVINPQVHALIIHWTTVFRPIVLIAVGLFCGVLCLVVLSTTGKRKDTAGTYSFEGTKGPIDISLKALEDYIAKHFAGKPVAHSVRTRVGTSRDRKKIRVRASITVWSEQSIKTAGESVQHEIRQCLKDGLGLDNVEDVHVSVDKIVASKSSRPAPKFFAAKPVSEAATDADEPPKDV